jgi:alkylation response protein AidB-like acyl-CoA dehydrogenase
VTAFLAFQHFGASRQIAGSENDRLKAELLPAFASGTRFCTLAFSHLRRPGPPVLRVERDVAGFVFNGVAPWATGWGLADEVLLAGTLPDGNSLWVVAPLVQSDSLQPSPPMRLCAVSASATVSLTCRGLRVGPERFVKTVTRAQLMADTVAGMLGHSALSLGVVRAAVTLLRQRGKTLGSQIPAAADALEQEAAKARRQVNVWADRASEADYQERVLRARAWCIDLGVRAAHAAVAASGGAANSLDHPAQRLFREAMLYTVTAQTTELWTMLLERLWSAGGTR